jgi:hypothetical protein
MRSETTCTCHAEAEDATARRRADLFAQKAAIIAERDGRIKEIETKRPAAAAREATARQEHHSAQSAINAIDRMRLDADNAAQRQLGKIDAELRDSVPPAVVALIDEIDDRRGQFERLSPPSTTRMDAWMHRTLDALVAARPEAEALKTAIVENLDGEIERIRDSLPEISPPRYEDIRG